MKIIITNILFLLCFVSFAQLESNHWYFGHGAGLDFSDSITKADTNGKLYAAGACASISDKKGNLLFYSDGDTIWNRIHQPMQNGINISVPNPHQYSAVMCIIVPQPGNTSLYYIFSIPFSSTYNLYYSIVDMSANNGLGEVISKRNFLLPNVCAKLTAIHHANKQSIWLITHLWQSNAFYLYLIDKNGLTSSPLIRHVGSVHHSPYPNNFSTRHGNLKASPDGKKLVSLKYTNTSGINAQTNFEVFDFNDATGVISNPVDTCEEYPMYCEFSSNGEYLYMSKNWEIFQYKFSNINESTFFSSGINLNLPNSSQLQLGNDGKIYIGKESGANIKYHYLTIINYPNKEGFACNAQDTGIYLYSGIAYRCLPFFIQSYFFKPDFEAVGTCEGDSTLFYIADSSRVDFSQMDSILWVFDDSLSGVENYSSLWKPRHLFSDTGLYNVQMIVYHDSIADTSAREIRIAPYPHAAFSINDSLQCFHNNFLCLTT
jgi:hypothetical protein